MSQASNTPRGPYLSPVQKVLELQAEVARLEARIAELEGALREIRDELILDYEGAGRDAHAIAAAALAADPLHPPDPVVREALEQEC